VQHATLPEGSLSVFVGRHGEMNPAGRVRCNIVPIVKSYCRPAQLRCTRVSAERSIPDHARTSLSHAGLGTDAHTTFRVPESWDEPTVIALAGTMPQPWGGHEYRQRHRVPSRLSARERWHSNHVRVGHVRDRMALRSAARTPQHARSSVQRSDGSS